MFPLVFAMVVLSSPDPDPVATSAAGSLARRLPGAFDAAGIARGDMSASDASFGDVRVAPFCSYGASARGGVATLADAAAIASSFSEPACESDGFTPGAGFGPLGFAYQGFASGFGMLGGYGALAPVRFASPIRPIGFSGGAVSSAVAAPRPPVALPAAPVMLQSQPAIRFGAAPAGAQGGAARSGAPVFRVLPGLFGAVGGGAFDRATRATGPSMRMTPVMRVLGGGVPVRTGGAARTR